MLNQIILVGRLVGTPVEKITENGKSYTAITLAVPRSFKNEEGFYDTDFIDCTLWKEMATQTSTFCKNGDLIGIRGRLAKLGSADKLTIDVDRVTFLSANNNTQRNDLGEGEI